MWTRVCVGVHLWAVTTRRPQRCKGLMGFVLIEIKIKWINLGRAFQSALMKEGLFWILNQNKIKIEIKKDQIKYPYLKNQRGKASRRKWDLSATEFPHHHPTLFPLLNLYVFQDSSQPFLAWKCVLLAITVDHSWIVPAVRVWCDVYASI